MLLTHFGKVAAPYLEMQDKFGMKAIGLIFFKFNFNFNFNFVLKFLKF